LKLRAVVRFRTGDSERAAAKLQAPGGDGWRGLAALARGEGDLPPPCSQATR
jgi:hypothetical protein